MRFEMTFEGAVRMRQHGVSSDLKNVITCDSKHSLTFRITVKKKLEMNTETHFQALIKAAI